MFHQFPRMSGIWPVKFETLKASDSVIKLLFPCIFISSDRQVRIGAFLPFRALEIVEFIDKMLMTLQLIIRKLTEKAGQKNIEMVDLEWHGVHKIT